MKLGISSSAALLGAIFFSASPLAHAATYNWNTTTGTWDTSTVNWTGAGTTWVDSNDALFNNTAMGRANMAISGGSYSTATISPPPARRPTSRSSAIPRTLWTSEL